MSFFTPPQRPPSRSERLLRDTLRRDGEVRDTALALASPRRSSRSGSHSRVASPPPPPLPPHPTLDYDYDYDYDYSRPSSPPPRRRQQHAELLVSDTKGASVGRSPRTSGLTESTVTPGSRTGFENRNGSRSISPSPSPSPAKGAHVSRRHSLQRALDDHRASSHMSHPVRGGLGQRDNEARTRSGSLSQPQSAAFTLSTPPFSSPGSSSSLQDHSTFTHVRSRSSTDPILTPSHTYTYVNSPVVYVSPNSTSRAPTGSATNTTTLTPSSSSTSMSSSSQTRNPSTYPTHPQHYPSHQQSRRKHVPIEHTPPLTADASPTGIGEGNELEPDYQLDADDSRLITPPPSPPPPHHHQQPHPSSPYRPMGDWYCAEVYALNHHGVPTKPVHPQFNVRKASEQCKLIDGYVSFVSIEGLGGPPESNSPALVDGEGDNEHRNSDKRMFNIGWDRWKKLLPLAVVGGTNGTTGEHESAVMSLN